MCLCFLSMYVDHVLNRIQLLVMPCYGNNIVVNFLLELFYTHFVYFIIQAFTHKIQHRDDENDDHQLNFWNKIYKRLSFEILHVCYVNI